MRGGLLEERGRKFVNELILKKEDGHAIGRFLIIGYGGLLKFLEVCLYLLVF